MDNVIGSAAYGVVESISDWFLIAIKQSHHNLVGIGWKPTN
jgi:hypothetical protein